jgi:hypothetical protein
MSRRQIWMDLTTPEKKGILDYIPNTSGDPSVGPHPVSLILSTKEVVGLSQTFVDSRPLVLPGLYHQHAIGTFNTCSLGLTHRSLTDTGGGYNHLRALSSVRLSNLNIASSEVGWNIYRWPVVFRPLGVYWSLYLRLSIANVTQILARSSRVIRKVIIM